MGDTAIMQRTLASKSGRQDVWLATSCPPASHMWVPGGQRPGYQLSSSESPVAVRPYVITPVGPMVAGAGRQWYHSQDTTAPLMVPLTVPLLAKHRARHGNHRGAHGGTAP